MLIKFERIIIILMFSLAIIAPSFAHSGRTDSNGGHYVTATGEYHYHHGYPAHDHIDGVCPYNTIKTNNRHNSISTSSSTSAISNNLYIILGATGICMFTIKTRYKHYKEKKQFDENKEHYKSIYEGKSPFELAKVPTNIQFDTDNLPIIIDGSGLKWGKEYTVYLSKTGSSYHSRQGCSNSVNAVHIFTIFKSKTACRKCVHTDIKIPNWYFDYIEIKKIKDRYNIN